MSKKLRECFFCKNGISQMCKNFGTDEKPQWACACHLCALCDVPDGRKCFDVGDAFTPLWLCNAHQSLNEGKSEPVPETKEVFHDEPVEDLEILNIGNVMELYLQGPTADKCVETEEDIYNLQVALRRFYDSQEIRIKTEPKGLMEAISFDDILRMIGIRMFSPIVQFLTTRDTWSSPEEIGRLVILVEKAFRKHNGSLVYCKKLSHLSTIRDFISSKFVQ